MLDYKCQSAPTQVIDFHIPRTNAIQAHSKYWFWEHDDMAIHWIKEMEQNPV